MNKIEKLINEIELIEKDEKINQKDFENLIQKINEQNIISDFNLMQIYNKNFQNKSLSEFVFEKIFEVEVYDDLMKNLLKTIKSTIKNKNIKYKDFHFQLTEEEFFYLQNYANEKNIPIAKYIKDSTIKNKYEENQDNQFNQSITEKEIKETNIEIKNEE